MAFFALLKPFWPLIWRAGLALVLVLTVWWAWGHFVRDPYIAQGVALEAPKTAAAEAANKTLVADLKKVQDAYAQQAMQVAELATRTAISLEKAQAAMASLRKANAGAQVEIDRLRAIAAQPPAATKEQDCEDARLLLDAVTARRMRDE